MLQNCKIIDTTLREGEQTPGILFSVTEKKVIIDGLAETGVHEVELGIASRLSPCLPELVAYCTATRPELQTSIWSRCREEDIAYAGSLRPQVISLSMPASDLHLRERLNKDREWAVRTLAASITSARAQGMRVSVGFEDATRAEVNFLLHLARVAAQAGAFRIRIADTVGIGSPGTMRALMVRLVEELPAIEFAAHTHNDFGMATANAIASLESGATWVDATVLGLGERCGCARLEELAAYLHLIGHNPSFRVEKLKPLAQYIARCASLRIADNLPILGKKIFTCETGLHLQGLQAAPETYEPYAPEKVGASRQLIYGAKTGRRALSNHLKSLGHTCSEESITATLRTVRDTARAAQRSLFDTELENISLQL